MGIVTITLDFDPVVMCFTITGVVVAIAISKWWKGNKS